MGKAALIINMPNDCSECEYLCRLQSGRCCILCNVAPKISNHRPSWCPLRPIPEKREQHPFPKGYDEGWDNGWNACIDKILE